MSNRGPTLITAKDLVHLSNDSPSADLLVLDLRVFAQYSASRVQGALNLCIPTTLLKRPAYTVKKLSEAFSNRQDDQTKFEGWREAKTIVVYDVASWTLAQATSCVQVIQKFLNEKWKGATYVLKGGFSAFYDQYPDEVDQRRIEEVDRANSRNLSINSSQSAATSTSLVGGCEMPRGDKIQPFFNTIRQNMDLIGGVGQFPLRRPSSMSDAQAKHMPFWLQQASDPKDEGKLVADRFLGIEKAEQKRMEKALSSTSYFGDRPSSPHVFRMAGIEMGGKNRYKDILPFESTRVKLKERNGGDSDYVNASHVRPASTRMHYIASQAPVPSTFADFWRVVWEQAARVIVMLTAESEQGHTKADPYWASGTYGPFKLDLTHQEDQQLQYRPDLKPQRVFSSPLNKPFTKTQQPVLNRRHTSNTGLPHAVPSARQKPPQSPPEDEVPHVTVRRILLRNTSEPSRPPRPINQVQLASWPDTGTTARPKDILALVELCDSLDTVHSSFPATSPTSNRPIIVHCSAGCGRTGTFCTIANVKNMLRKQLAHRQSRGLAQRLPSSAGQQPAALSRTEDSMDIDGGESSRGGSEKWVGNEDIDLIAQTVSEFRLHRMSMVQTLRQFVLCYEAIMELFMHDDWVYDEGDHPSQHPPLKRRGENKDHGPDPDPDPDRMDVDAHADAAMDVDGDREKPSALADPKRALQKQAVKASRPKLGKRSASGI